MSDVPLPSIPEKYRLTSEFRLLAACSWIAASTLEQEQSNKIAALCRGGINWDVFVALVRRHGVPALAYSVLCRYADECLPDEVREALRERNRASRLQALLQAAELLRLIKLFVGQGIDLIPLKGVFLSHQLYDDIGMRSSCDLDVLVRPEHLEKVGQLLEIEGYTCCLLGKQLTPKQRVYLTTYFHHLEYGRASKNICLELHWRFGSLWLPEQMAAVWSRTRKIEWMGHPTSSLDDDTQLLFLCDHGARHGFESLKWLSDIARILSSERSQGWGSLFDLAGQLDLKRTLASSALLVHWLYGIPLADNFKESIRNDKKAVSISTTLYTQICLSEAAKNSTGKSKGSLKLAWQILRLKPSLPMSMVLKPKLIAIFDFLDFPLPDRLFWLYYPLRPVSLFWRHFLQKSPGKRA